jgi:serine/threonine protein phosphatase PrpC
MAELILRSTALTHVGRVRQGNEDNYLDRPDAGLWAVADGMGGHQAGEVASGLLVQALAQVDARVSGYAFLDEIQAAVQRVNLDLRARAAALRPGAVIGSTLVLLLASEGHYACLWAGDSRAYRLRDGLLQQITHDHSVAQDLIDSGALSRADARTSKAQHVLTRAVGVAETLALDMREGDIRSGDLFLLCSDGLTGMVEDDEIGRILQDLPRADAAQALLALALERGGRDNITLVLVAADVSPDGPDTR